MATQNAKYSSICDQLSLTLRLGSLISVALLALGFLLFIITGSRQPQFTPELGQLLKAIVKLDSLAIISLGIVVLLLTPLSGITVVIVAFAKQKDRLYAVLSLTIGLALILSTLLSLL